MKHLIISLASALACCNAFSQNRYDVVINELMPDPSPQIGLPNSEWIELRNTSTSPFNLQNWRIGDASSQSGPLPNFLLKPDSAVIVCTSGSIAAMAAFGTCIAVTSFPSLDNEGDIIYVKAPGGKTIHAIRYSLNWYRNELKKEGGWSLEMIDPRNACSGESNWKASVHALGGTPGQKNSVDSINKDQSAPALLRAYAPDDRTIILRFNETLDSLIAANITNYQLTGGLQVTSAITLPPLFNEVELKTNSAMTANIIYTITASEIKDCSGNLIGTINKTRVGLASEANPKDWIINEILFNPPTAAYDYVEFYNNSKKILDASKLSVANRNSTGTISSIRLLNTTPFLIFPGDYIVVTEDTGSLTKQYDIRNHTALLSISSMPSFPDDEGTVLTLNSQGELIDEVNYKDDWHFALINNDEGVSLERINPTAPVQQASNWHSAASTAGYGTPGYKNSQYIPLDASTATFSIQQKIFSPDNDGREDVAVFQYQVDSTGYVGNVVIFDAAGRQVKKLVRNDLLSLSGSWNWDGLADQGNKLPVGIYIIFSEIFNLQGKRQVFKNTIVLARKLR